MLTGIVVEYHGEFITVRLDHDHKEIQAKHRTWESIKSKRWKKGKSLEGATVFARDVTVGDRVMLMEADEGHYFVESTDERSSWLIRKGVRRFSSQYQLVAANADQLAVVVSPKPRIVPGLIDRYFLAALNGGLDPMLIVNKLDLDPSLPDDLDLRIYQELGYPVHFTCATEGLGMDKLEAVLLEKSTVFCGLSGVGKSTILSKITGQHIATGEVKKRGTGKQTTVDSRMYFLKQGGNVIDTPGIRVFGLALLNRTNIRSYFSDIEKLSLSCQYPDCSHTHEPECNVREAIRLGEMSTDRVESYLKLISEFEAKYWERVVNT